MAEVKKIGLTTFSKMWYYIDGNGFSVTLYKIDCRNNQILSVNKNLKVQLMFVQLEIY